eukprot:1136893-Pelagomonas_calceolata.AAC.6
MIDDFHHCTRLPEATTQKCISVPERNFVGARRTMLCAQNGKPTNIVVLPGGSQANLGLRFSSRALDQQPLRSEIPVPYSG